MFVYLFTNQLIYNLMHFSFFMCAYYYFFCRDKLKTKLQKKNVFDPPKIQYLKYIMLFKIYILFLLYVLLENYNKILQRLIY